MNNLNNGMPYNDIMPEIGINDDVYAPDMNKLLAQLFSNDKDLNTLIRGKGSSNARNIVLTGPLNLRGAANALRDRYSENLCVGGQAISSGNGGVGLSIPDNAFDGNKLTTGWESLQKRNACSGTAWIGYRFNVARTIKKIMLYQNDTGGGVTSVKIQYSSDGTTWNDAMITTIAISSNVQITGNFTARYWRLLANGNGIDGSSVSGWGVREVEMYELLNLDLTGSNILLQAGTLIDFADGMSDTGPVDYIKRISDDITLSLAAADQNTVPLSYTDNLCNGGTAISGGDYSGYPSSYAFDNTQTSDWYSSQSGTAVANISWIGYNFGVARAIRRMYIDQLGVSSVASIKIQYSDDGTNWTTAGMYITGETYAPTTPSSIYYNVPAVGAHQYWRVLAIANPSSGSWVMQTIEMYEALQTYYVYTTRDAKGNLTIGSTRNKPRVAKSVIETSTTLPGYYTGNLCTGGTPISSGDYSDRTKDNAFDNNTTSNWVSSQTGTAVANTAYIGYNFGTSKSIRKIAVTQSPVPQYAVTSIKVQYSPNGTEWTDATTFGGISATNNIFSLTLPIVGNYQYWRLLALTNTTDALGWGVHAIEMYEYVDPSTSSTTHTDDTTYSDNLCIGGAAIATSETIGAPKEAAFDGNSATGWSSNLVEALFSRAIGYDFGVARSIRKIVFTTNTNPNGTPSAFKIQKSTDGTTWLDVLNYTGVVLGTNTATLPAGAGARYWRMLASGTKLSGSTVLTDGTVMAEITMHEVSTDINLYDPIAGVSKHYDGSTWDNVVRVFLGEAVVDSAGSIVSYTTYPYNKSKLKALSAEDSDDVVTLGQLAASLSAGNTSWLKLPVIIAGVKVDLIVQWGLSAAISGGTITFPIAFPTAPLTFVPVIGNATSFNTAYTIAAGLWSKTGIVCWHGGGAVSLGIVWIAIGY